VGWFREEVSKVAANGAEIEERYRVEVGQDHKF
jgi:hypothetical protein